MKIRILFSFLILIILVETTSAAILGVSPGNLNYERVLRGGYAERNIRVTFGSDELVMVSLEPRGQISSWLNFSQSEFEISKENSQLITVSVSPPEDMPNGNYTGYLRLFVDAIDSPTEDGMATGFVKTVLDVAILVEVTDIEYVDCRARNFYVESVEQGDDIVFSVDVLNKGNIRLKPLVEIEIWDNEMLNLIDTSSIRGEEITPTQEKKLSFKFPSRYLDKMQYWAEFSVIECLASDFLTFDILEPGELRAKGIIKGIYTTLWTEVRETVPIEIEFENIGEKNVVARFKGEISLGGRIIRLLESEEIIVPESGTENFTFFFTPEDPGRHIITGRVFYDKKKTFESAAIMNVEKRGVDPAFLTLFIYGIAILTLIFLIYSIRKEKRRYLKKFEFLLKKHEK
ncbi:hypothetical protein K0A97_02605 [Patescibacteria group bacterium]|nr:hypothetical protein [Patescibacteria group bacterium]